MPATVNGPEPSTVQYNYHLSKSFNITEDIVANNQILYGLRVNSASGSKSQNYRLRMCFDCHVQYTEDFNFVVVENKNILAIN